jgi:hypothetical protein
VGGADVSGPLAKTISQFQPLSTSTREECDRYYREVHTRFARGFLREMPHVRSYHIGLAESSYDVAGGWAAPPQTFRYVVLRFDPGTGLTLSTGLRERIAQDHRVFLRELRGFSVDEEVLVDRLSGQTALVKYQFEYDRRDGEAAEAGAARLRGQLDRLVALSEEASGLRLLLADHVRCETGSEPIDEPGQRGTGERVPATSRQAFLELYFDQPQWAEEWFRRDDVRSALLGEGWARAHGVRVDEECGLDRR